MPYSNKQFILDLASFIKPYKGAFFLGVFLRIISDLARLYPIWALSVIIPLLTGDIQTELLPRLWILLGLWAVTAIIGNLSQQFAKYLGFQVAEKAGLDFYSKTLAHVLKLDLSWQEEEGSGNKMKRIDRGRDGMNEMIRRVFDVIIEVIVNTVGIFLIFFTLQKSLSIAIVVFIVTYFLIGTYLLKRAIRQEKIVNIKFEALSGLTFESLNNIHTIKSLGIDQSILKLLRGQLNILVEEIRKRIYYFRLQYGVLNGYFYLWEFVIIVIIVLGIVRGEYTVSLLVLFIGLFQKIGDSTDELTDLAQQIVVNKIWVSRAMELLRTVPVIENDTLTEKQVSYPENWKKLELKNIHFSYKKGQALTDISLTIKRGESVGIVGLSGAGKSTLFKLLLDLYENYEGEILLDSVPLKSIKRQAYIDHVAVVLQDTELFNMSLGDNIQIAGVEKKASKTKLQEAVQMAHLSEVVSHLPQGLDTIVGEKGTKLSGGQRQRVGIARALFRQPDILLLDEATSHLDGESEKQIQLALAEVMHNFTTIVIAHRLSTIQKMDTIIVMERGKVKEIGSFKELTEKNGSFAKMWKLQRLA